MPRENKTMTDHDALLAIQELMDGVEWSADTLDGIAKIMVSAGYRIRDLDYVDLEYSEPADIVILPDGSPVEWDERLRMIL
jgi:hypothetical protein